MVTKGPKLERDDSGHRINIFCPTGFHGDTKLMQVVDSLAAQCQYFVETGTEAGSTVAYVARMYPHLSCFTCEADPGTTTTALMNLQNHENVELEQALSQEWMLRLPTDEPTLFWLDAHSHGFGCPLGAEVNIALEKWVGGYILIDDFQVPGRGDFGFDWYVGEYGEYKLTLDTILEGLPEPLKSRIKSIHFPNYQPPRIAARGWILIQFGNIQNYEVPAYMTTI